MDPFGADDPSTPPTPAPPVPVPLATVPPAAGPTTPQVTDATTVADSTTVPGPDTGGGPGAGGAPAGGGPTALTGPPASGGPPVPGPDDDGPERVARNAAAAGPARATGNGTGERNGTTGGSVPESNDGARGAAESPWALPPRRPSPGGPEPARRPDGTAAGGTEAGDRPGGTGQEGPGPDAGGRTTPGPAGTAAHPPGPFPPVMNPPGPLPPTPYPPATDGTPADPYAAGPPAAGPYAARGSAAVPGPPAGWGSGSQPGPAAPPDPARPAQPGPPRPDQPLAGPGQPGPGPLDAGQPGWYPPGWPQPGQPPVAPVTHPPYQEADGVTRVPSGYPDAGWTPDFGTAPTAEDFARRRQVRPADPVATMGVRAVVNKTGLIKLPPGRHEQELRRDIEMVRRNFGGLRQVTVVNPKGGAGKTVAILLLAMTFGQKRGGYVLAWDNNETQGTLGMRAQQDFHSRTVRDMLRDLGQFQGAHGRVGDLSQYVRSQGEGMFDVLASDESATGGEMLTAAAFAEIREVVSRFYKLIFVDTGNNVRAQNWQAAMDATDQLVVTMSARNDSAETAARMLDHLEQSGRHRLVRQAVTVVSMPPSRKEIDLPAIQEHFAARTRAVLLAPYERLIDTGEPIRYGGLSSATRDAWLKIAASVAEGL
nr:chromosome partitioning protein [Micromonospora sp. MW-13]